MNPVVFGFDTSCYATSVACVNHNGIVFQKKTMLSVASGERGLRQSDGVFLHVRNLDGLCTELFDAAKTFRAAAAAVSASPTAAPDSYMPVFLAGVATASAAAGALRIPLIRTNHQAGHIRAALVGNESLISHDTVCALHLSGGTTDLLRIGFSHGCIASITRIGGCDDLHIGQFVDRVGVRLGLGFPAGPELEKLALSARERTIRLPASVRGLECSFSGPESQAQRLIDDGGDRAEIAYAVYDCAARTVAKLLHAAAAGEVLLCGGVSGSTLFRQLLHERSHTTVFASDAGLSGDNAVGVALIGMDRLTAEGGI